ncbi:MAG: FtsX-like permease family protein [Bacteroidota bacterium]
MQAPRWAEKLFLWYCKETHREYLLGDLYELFDLHLEKQGPLLAKLRFVLGVLDLCRPFAWKRLSPPKLYHHRDMLKHYFKIGWRSLLRHRALSFINVLGLTLGLTVCLLMLMYVRHELGFDKFHENSDRMVRVWSEFHSQGESIKAGVTPNIILPLLKRTYPEQVQTGVRVYKTDPLISYGDQVYREDACLFVDSSFFEVFSFELQEGDPATALTNPTSIILTRSMATKFFGAEPALGKVVGFGGKKTPFKVTGIVADPPSNTQIEFRMLVPFHTLRWASQNETFGSANYFTFLVLDRPESGPDIQAKFPEVMEELGGEELVNSITYHLQPFEEMYLYSSDIESYGPVKSGNANYIYLFTTLALLVLLIAVINYVNLTTARSIDRAREVGLRKVIGAQRRQLIQQFLGETTLVALIALACSLLLFQALVPLFSMLVDRELDPVALFEPNVLIGLIGGGLLLGMLAGIYPALILSNYQPVSVMQGKFGNSGKGLWLRRGLVIFQFTISVILIAGAMIIQRQIEFFQDKELGYSRERIIHTYVGGQQDSLLTALRIDLENDPSVLGTTTATEAPHNIGGGYGLSTRAGEDGGMVTAMMVDEKYLETMEMTLLSGRNYSPAQVQEEPDSGKYAFLINEQTLDFLELEAEESIGTFLDLNGRHGFIQGVVKDFHFASLHQPIGPLVLFNGTSRNQLMIKMAPGPTAPNLIRISDIWQKHVPNLPFDYRFLDDSYENMYRSEEQTRQFSLVFAILAIFIAILGLIGLAAYTIVQRTQEIGIRKVLGAEPLQLVSLLSREFTIMVGIAFLIGSPITVILLSRWLENFAYQVPIGWSIFAITGILALAVAWLTVSGLAYRAAHADPVRSIRSE